MKDMKHTKSTSVLSYIFQKMNMISLSIMVKLMLSTKHLYNAMISIFLLKFTRKYGDNIVEFFVSNFISNKSATLKI